MDLWHVEHLLICVHNVALALGRLQAGRPAAEPQSSGFKGVGIALEALHGWLDRMDLRGLQTFRDALDVAIEGVDRSHDASEATRWIRAPLEVLCLVNEGREEAALEFCCGALEALARGVEGRAEDYTTGFYAPRLLEACGPYEP